VSKAFTSEETPDEGPLTRPPPRLAPGEVRYVTPEGQAALRAALEAARAEGPAGAAQAARLSATLATLTVLGPEATPEGEVAFGSWVTVEDAAGRRSTWRLVGPDEVDPRRGLVSVHAPVARALLGRCAGDEAELPQPGGVRAVTVVSVRRVPD
jgi:transcription elongation factor GreB